MQTEISQCGGFNKERRRGDRVPLSWAAKLIGRNSGILQAITQNLSCSGFYCIAGHRPMLGEMIACQIAMPSSHVSNGAAAVALLCRGRVTRIDFLEEDRYGIGCVMEDYKIVEESMPLPTRRAIFSKF